MNPVHIPDARIGAMMAYDAARKKIVLFGGHDWVTTSDANDTWTWDGTDWTLESPVHVPPITSYGAMAYDRAVGVTVLFGGLMDNWADNQMWEWDGTDWTRWYPPPVDYLAPEARAYSAMAYDDVRQVIVLFGGNTLSLSAPLNDDTWEWDGTRWTKRHPIGPPLGRLQHEMTYDAARQRIVLYGGETQTSPVVKAHDLWEWDGTSWIQRTTAGQGRNDFAFAYDRAREQVIAFSGGQFNYSSDMAVYQFRTTLPDDQCDGAFDGDQDGVVGCADPDCWGRCTPFCAPGATCDPSAPSCGDTSCSSLETCTLCPSDCGACAGICGDYICQPSETHASCPGDCM
jgi:hypothetical protein